MPSHLTTTTLISSILQPDSSIVPDYRRPQSSAYTATGWTSPNSLPTRLLSGDPSTILFAFLVTLSLPVLLHLYFYTQSARSGTRGGSGGDGTPTFILLGPSGSGKTSLVTVLQRRANITGKATGTGTGSEEDEQDTTPNGITNGNTPTPTRLTQQPTSHPLTLPPTTPLGTNKYRSPADTELTRLPSHGPPYTLLDTPGHGKLRASQSLSHLSNPSLASTLRGTIFLLDASSLESPEITRDTTEYLHDTLLALQRRPATLRNLKSKTRAKTSDVRVLIAANKQDLFTSLPPTAVRERLQVELEKVRIARQRGISAVDARDDGTGAGGGDGDDDQGILGGGGEEKFSFKTLEEEFGVSVEVLGGTCRGDDGGEGVVKWEGWIGGCL